MRKFQKNKLVSESSSAGFTLLEVMASVVIIGVAMTAIMVEGNESVRRVAITNNMRTATMLAQQKMAEILLGTETNTGGEFEGHEKFSWKLEEATVVVLQEEQQAPSLRAVSLTVVYPAGPDEAELTLNAHLRGGK